MLDKNSGLKQTHVLLEKPLINVSCPDQTEGLKRDRINTDMTGSKKKKEFQNTYRKLIKYHLERIRFLLE
jgi:hypothetical protein